MEAEYPWGLCEAYARATKAYFSDMLLEVIPTAPSSRGSWFLGKLLTSAKHLSKAEVVQEVLPELESMLRSLTRGQEMSHLKALLNKADFRGSDVRLLSQTLVDGSRQQIPYPAPIWDWKCVQSYQWQESQHINVLELTAFFIYSLEMRAATRIFNSYGLFMFLTAVSAVVLSPKGGQALRC
jgi:hypothetical protein